MSWYIVLRVLNWESCADWGIQWNLGNSNYRGPQQSLGYDKFELWVMLSFCISHVATVASPFRPSVLHFLAKLSIYAQQIIITQTGTMKLGLS